VITKKELLMIKIGNYLPRSKAIRFDGDKVYFDLSKEETKRYRRD
jgi:hypothetical protein